MSSTAFHNMLVGPQCECGEVRDHKGICWVRHEVCCLSVSGAAEAPVVSSQRVKNIQQRGAKPPGRTEPLLYTLD